MSLDALDIIEIHQLLSFYGHLVDAKAWDRFELFLPGCEMDYTLVNAPRVFHSRDEIAEWFSGVNHPSAHHVVNIVVHEDPHGVVRVKSKFFVPFTRPSHAPLGWYGGDYDDVVERTPDGWRFAYRRCSARWRLAEGVAPDGRATF